jgi:hypothetical protein
VLTYFAIDAAEAAARRLTRRALSHVDACLPDRRGFAELDGPLPDVLPSGRLPLGG